MILERDERLGELLRARLNVGEQSFLSIEPKVFRCDCAGERIGRVGVAVEERFEFLIASHKRPEYFFSSQSGGQRQVAASQTFGDAEKVRRDVFVFYGEHLAGSSEACCHL